MKKLMFAAAVRAVGAAMAIESQIVGYQNFDIKAGKWYLIGAQFQTLSGTAIDLQDFIKSENLTPGETEYDENAPTIKKYDGSGYVTYVYSSGNDMGDEFDPPAWLDNGGDPAANININVGESVWFMAKSDASISVAGQVVSAGAKDVTLVANKWNLLANPYPEAFELNGDKFDCSNLVPGGNEYDTSAPTLKVYDGSGYVTYVYASENDMGDEFDPPQWLDNGGDPTEVSVASGAGIWLMYKNSAESLTVKFTK